MTEQPTTEHIPEWDLADRLRKSLRDSGLGVQEMADYLGVSRKTVGNWTNGHVTPGRPELRLWALRTGVPMDWLLDGTVPPFAAEKGRPVTIDQYPAGNLSITLAEAS